MQVASIAAKDVAQIAHDYGFPGGFADRAPLLCALSLRPFSPAKMGFLTWRAYMHINPPKVCASRGLVNALRQARQLEKTHG